MGRFGREWARLLAERTASLAGEYRVVVGSKNSTTVPAGCTAAPLPDLARSDIIFLTVAISAMEETLQGIAPHLSETSILCDTCSVKTYPAGLMQRIIPAPTALIGTHPLFGPDSLHPAAAAPGAPPTASKHIVAVTALRANPAQVQVCTDLLRACTLQVIPMSADEHDRQVAATQGITHLIGRILKDMGVGPEQLTTLGYQKLLEVMEQTCNDSRQLFLDLERHNPYSPGITKRLSASLERIVSEIDAPQNTPQ